MTTTTTTTMPTSKKKYLVTDPGFGTRFIASLVFVASAYASVNTIPSLHSLSSDLVAFVEERMMRGAHALAWWSLIALLASSCCALQVILSAAALGCSGLNTVLGPFRPLALATTAALQFGAWHTVVRQLV